MNDLNTTEGMLMGTDVADMIEDMRLMFEYEYCEECGGDFEDHDLMVVPGLGLFAQCKGGGA
jgi:hypothetical protein